MASAKVILCVSSRLARSRLLLLRRLIASLLLLGAGCLLLGFMTPVTAILIELLLITFALSSLAQIINIVVLSPVIALLGPGAFSIDGRMFGLREILVPNPSRSPKP